MALKATVYKANLSISNMDLHYYKDHNLILAKHPSESNSRMMFRLLAFSLLAQEEPEFTKGISSENEPSLWCHNLSGEITHWIELGQPTEKRIRQACSKADQVTIFTYQPNAGKQWFHSIESQIQRFKGLQIVHFSILENQSLEGLVERNMELSCTIQDSEIWLSSENNRVGIEFNIAKDR